jgi:hypothetical protein
MTPKEACLKCSNENRRILELESIIAADPKYSYKYARDVIKGRFKKGERSIATDKIFSYRYARDIIKRRWKQGEKSIIIDIEYAYHYANDVIKGKFIEGESSIATHPEHSYSYVHNVIKGPFPLAHPIIFNSKWKYNYINFLKSINYDLSEIEEWLI